MDKQEFLEAIRGQMIVSCQALPGEPLYVKEATIMHLMARAAKEAGAPAIRANGVRDIIAIKKETGLPVIGLVKVNYEGYDSYITPTMREVDDLITRAGADVVALDCTMRKRGDGSTINDFLAEIRRRYPTQLLMADVSTLEEGVNAWKCGVDLLGTTLSGYTPYSPRLYGPDYVLMERLAAETPIPVIGEGRIHEPREAVRALRTGVWAIVVGGAITRPLEIARRFYQEIRQQ